MAWLAELRTDRDGALAREAARRELRLDVPAVAGPTAARVLIHNISTTGLLVESGEEMPLAEMIEVELPEQGFTGARIVWRSDDFYGCQFDKPLSMKVVSAAQLRSPPEPRAGAVDPPRLESAPARAEAFAPVMDESEMSPRSKLAIIVGLSASLWGAILIGASQFV